MDSSTSQEKNSGPEMVNTRVERPLVYTLFLSFFLMSTYAIAVTIGISLISFKDIYNVLTPEQLAMASEALPGQIVLLILGVIIPSIILSYIFSQSANRPIRKMTAAIKRIAAGDLDHAITVYRKDELGTLEHLFNELMRRLREANERQERITEVKSQFVTVAAHQLRTPAAGIRWGLSEMLNDKKDSLSEKQRGITEKCLLTVEKLIRIVNNLLDAARADDQTMVYDFRPTLVGNLIKKVIKETALEAGRKGMQLRLTNDCDPELSIVADEEKLAMALANLIDNAIAYGTEKTTIHMHLWQTRETIHITIANQGIGISDNDAARLFQQFYRGNNALKTKTEGSGIGLFVTERILNRHQGAVALQSGKPEETVFEITLPIRYQLSERKPELESFMEAL